MTNARKIEILENVKKALMGGKLIGICSAFTSFCTDEENDSISTCISTIGFYLADLFYKHKPADYEGSNLGFWFPRTEENIPKRLEIIDKMIAELKTLEQ